MMSSYIYDDAITEALIRVGREAEYLPNDDTGDENRIKSYRMLYESALSWVVGELRSNLLSKKVVINQSSSLEDGWGYLPLDFIMFEESGSNYNVKLSQENGQKIIEAVGGEVSYMAMPKYVHSLYYNLTEATIYKFLSNCTLRDSNFAQYYQVVNEQMRGSLVRAGIEAKKLIQNTQQSMAIGSITPQRIPYRTKLNIFGD
jgi:hypothetical protein